MKVCPFCGGKVIVKNYQRLGYWIQHADNLSPCRIVFEVCREDGSSYDGGREERKALIKAWNDRVETSGVSERKTSKTRKLQERDLQRIRSQNYNAISD